MVDFYLDKCVEAKDSQSVLLAIQEFWDNIENENKQIEAEEIWLYGELKTLEADKNNIRTASRDAKRNRCNTIKDKLNRDISLVTKRVEKLNKDDKTHMYSLGKYTNQAEKIEEERLRIVTELKRIQEEKIELLKYCAEQELAEVERIEDREREEKLLEIEKKIDVKQKKHKSNIDNKKKAIKESIKVFFTDDRLVNKISMLKAVKSTKTEYVNPEKLPEYLEMGSIQFNKSSVSSNHYEDYECINSTAVFDDGTITLPLMKYRRTGFAFFSQLDLKKYIVDLQNLILKQLMTFPAGRLELVMFDKSNTSFFSPFYSCLSKTESKKIVDAKVWVEDNDIVREISNVRKRLSSYISEYGNQFEENIKARETRENFRIIAITGFPDGFNVNALKDLRTIVKEGGSYGVNTIICADVVALERAMEHTEKKAIIDDIMQNMDIVRENSGQTVIDIMSNNTRRTYNVDFSNMIFRDDILSILSAIAKQAGEYNKESLALEDIASSIVDEANWLTFSSKNGFSIPIGRQGYDNIINLTLGRKDRNDTRHHVLIEGTTGSGKSNVIHTLMISALMMYDPSELEIYFLDYKNGAEANVYSQYDLQAFKVISVNGERMFGLMTLRKLVNIMNMRIEMMKESFPDSAEVLINDYRNVDTNNKMSRILLVIDEIGAFLKPGDEITRESLECIHTLAIQGRVAGIHMILASQQITLESDIVENMVVRIAESGSKNLLESDNEYLVSVINAGNDAVFNESKGIVTANKAFRVVHIPTEEKKKMLAAISNVQRGENYTGRSEGKQNIFYSCVDNNSKHPFNAVKMYGKTSYKESTVTSSANALYLGEIYSFDDELDICFVRKQFSNLLIVGADSQKMYKLLYFTCLSLIHNNLQSDVDRQDMFIVDLGTGDFTFNNRMRQLENCFTEQIARFVVDDKAEDVKNTIEKVNKVIGNLYNEVVRRNDENCMEDQVLFLIINGAEYLHMLSTENVFNNSSEDILGLNDDCGCDAIGQMKYILKYGASVGIHCIIISNEYDSLCDYLGNNFENYFTDRLAFDLGFEEMKKVVLFKKNQSIGATSAVYYRVGNKENRVFRIYDYPKTDWVNAYAQQYELIRQKEK